MEHLCVVNAGCYRQRWPVLMVRCMQEEQEALAAALREKEARQPASAALR